MSTRVARSTQQHPRFYPKLSTPGRPGPGGTRPWPKTRHRGSFERLWRRVLAAFLVTGASLGWGAERTVRLHPESPLERFDGWGTSLCWFGNAVGRWSEPKRNAIADLLFSKDGLGLTVVRYNIGGGEAPGHHHMPTFRQMDGFEPAPGSWDWTADPGQRWMLAAAIRRGANRLEAFSNSPPYWMTISGCAAGSADAKSDNLAARCDGAFVEYLAEVTKHFQEVWGVRFGTLDPFNEPSTALWKAGGRQEGCHFDRSTQRVIIGRLRAALDARGLPDVGISASDETNFDDAIGTLQSFDTATLDLIAQVNVHAYATEHRTELRDLAWRLGKTVVMSEVDGRGALVHDHDAMDPALDLAERIIGDLRELRPACWVFWQAVEDEATQAAAGKNWGLIHADLGGKSETWSLTKKYFAMAGFSRYIRPGQVIIPVDDENSIAAFDAGSGILTIVTRNPAQEPVQFVYDLSSFGPVAGPAVPHRTSATEDLVQLAPLPFEGKRLSATIPAGSITTYVISGVALSGGGSR